VSFGEVARTAVAPPPDLVSSFHPTYNLAVNLVRRWSREEAEVVVDSSYGQWQAAPGSVSLAAQLDRRLTVLAKRGFVAGWRLTDAGATLASIYHESDLLVAEALGQGVLDRLGPAGLAGVVSALTFEARRSTEAARPARIRPSVAERLELLGALAASLRVDERRLGLRRTRMPDPGLAGAVVDWAEGASLETVLRESEVAPGDFVRNVRQLIDLLRQLAGTAREAGTSEDAGQAVVLLRRGVIGADDPAAVGSAPDRTGPP
jgi:ATP-dependent RNA helicase HelY